MNHNAQQSLGDVHYGVVNQNTYESGWCVVFITMLSSVWAVLDGPGDQNSMNKVSVWPVSLCSVCDLYLYARAWPVSLSSALSVGYPRCKCKRINMIWFIEWNLSSSLVVHFSDRDGEGACRGTEFLYNFCHACHSLVGVHYEGVEPENTCVMLVQDNYHYSQ